MAKAKSLDTASHDTQSDARRVLVVEDTVELAEVIQATLERQGMIAFTETHGQRALKRFEDIDPDLVLLDINLPDTIGWKVLDSIKDYRRTYHRPAVIVITAYGDPANRLMGKLQDVDAYLLKPFTPAEVEQTVQEVFERRDTDAAE
jgi:DNA-binding response OmpR family regulator